MDQKQPDDAADHSHHEKTASAPEYDGPARRESIALNIVQNPLQVRRFHLAFAIASDVDADHLSSAAPQRASLPMLKLLPRRMA